jgi:hypothetical protein
MGKLVLDLSHHYHLITNPNERCLHNHSDIHNRNSNHQQRVTLTHLNEPIVIIQVQKDVPFVLPKRVLLTHLNEPIVIIQVQKNVPFVLLKKIILADLYQW